MSGARLCWLGPAGQIPSAKVERSSSVTSRWQCSGFRLHDGGLRALAAVCPHRGGPLADGLIDGAQGVRPLHNHAFRLADGQCTTGARSVQAYQVTVEDGEVVLRPFGKAPVTTVA